MVNTKNRLIYYAVGGLMILIAVLAMKDAIGDYYTHGWSYTRTIQIESKNGVETTTEDISAVSGIFSSVFLVLIGVMLISSANQSLIKTYSISPESLNTNGVFFPFYKPEKWDISYLPDPGIIGVQLGTHIVNFPVSLIEGWMGEDLQPKDGSLLPPTYVGHETRETWTGELPFFIFDCPLHGRQKDYPHGWDFKLDCGVEGCRFSVFIHKDSPHVEGIGK